MRDYDKESIIIKDYGVMFSKTLLIIVAVAILLTVLRFAEEDFTTVRLSIRMIVVIICAIYILFLILIQIPRRFRKMPSYFEFSNDHIKYYEFNYEEEQKISSKNVSIKDETVFLYHWQIANPAFFDKDEQWYDEYEKKDVEKIGIIKKLLQRLKKNKT